MPNDFCDPVTLFITWTTYGSWLPGDARGWTRWKQGEQQPQPVLEDWCKDRMNENAVLLESSQRESVEEVIRQHAQRRGWQLHAVSARSNHVHIVVTVVPSIGDPNFRMSDGVKRVRDQFKANATRVLRHGQNPVMNEKVWTKGGDIQLIVTDDDLEQVMIYVSEAQDRMDRGKWG
ncbi:transposase [Crateriforma conspicua]|uniref:Transposase IS200 like protein n=1 Tax=Crateriforma conspicua TaxID=2527996 RepID=A0A5C5Y154_9PLAN|nr:transposase [Crateriforma conspicua]TWT69327.1 Transposase IS200 like protein [Crateriforma conspicua]